MTNMFEGAKEGRPRTLHIDESAGLPEKKDRDWRSGRSGGGGRRREKKKSQRESSVVRPRIRRLSIVPQ